MTQPRRSYITTSEAGDILGLAPATLVKWREKGIGPPCRKLGAAWRYEVSALYDWLDKQPQTGEQNATKKG